MNLRTNFSSYICLPRDVPGYVRKSRCLAILRFAATKGKGELPFELYTNMLAHFADRIE